MKNVFKTLKATLLIGSVFSLWTATSLAATEPPQKPCDTSGGIMTITRHTQTTKRHQVHWGRVFALALLASISVSFLAPQSVYLATTLVLSVATVTLIFGVLREEFRPSSNAFSMRLAQQIALQHRLCAASR